MWYEIDLAMDGDTWLVTSNDFPELTTFGDTQENAVRNGLKAVEEAIAARIADNVDFPYPVKLTTGNGWFVAIPTMIFLKIGLHLSVRRLGITRAELQRRMGTKHRETVDRLFRLDHNSRLDSMIAAFNAIRVPVTIDIDMDGSNQARKMHTRQANGQHQLQ